ncbi:MAG TPA: sialidase family protein [Gemmatimonadaceae bacterium]|nr:sialidase family protein [Gemmatimonadaceae bacterium]
MRLLSAARALARVFLAIPAAATLAAAQPSNRAILTSEFINAHAPYPASHASTIAQTTAGTLVAAWFGGSAEGNADVGIWVARHVGEHWANATEVATGRQPDGTRYASWNPVLFQAPDGPLVLFYKVGPSPQRWWGMMMTSADDGRTWSDARRLPAGVLGPIKDKPVALPNHVWLAGSSTEASPADWRVHFELTADEGRTWSVVGPVERGAGFQAIQPTLLFPGDGRIEALCRTQQGVIAMTWSLDGGRTWTPLAATELPNPNSGIDAVTLADGRLLLVYNHSAHLPGWSGHGYRSPLDVALSRDGVHWKHVLTIEDVPHSLGDSLPVDELASPPTGRTQQAVNEGFAYPAVIQSADGLVHVTYTWNRKAIKHVVLDPRKLF